MPFQIIRNDITKVSADAIVNTANPHPIVGGGTDTAIYKAAGMEQLLKERRKIGDIAPGDAAVTPAFGLDAKYIIHTVGPIWEGGDRGEVETLKSCYEKSLQLALDLGCGSIAFPLISAGVYDFPKDLALTTAISVINPFLLQHEMNVIMVVFNEEAFQLSGRLVDNVRSYIDRNYVEKAYDHEYGLLNSPAADISANRAYRDKRRISFKERISGRRAKGMAEPEEAVQNIAEPKAYASEPLPAPGTSKVSIDELLDTHEKTFQEKLFEIIDERHLTGPQVYNGYITRQVYSKIQGDRNYHPNKYTAIALCLSLHLSLEETMDLIGRAGWTLSPSNKADLIVRACILNQEYNVINIDLLLFDYHCPELSRIK